MGCWNKTCGLTNLHISDGDEVLVFVLEKHESDNRCYTTSFYKPLLLPFFSKYNDYGGGEDSSGVALPYILKGIQNLLEHDRDVEFTEDQFFEMVHDLKLNIKHHPSYPPTAVEFVMFRKDAVTLILNNWKLKKYVGGEEPYVRYTVSDIYDDIPAFLDEVQIKFDTITRLGELRQARYFDAMMSGSLTELFEYGHPNKVSWVIWSDNHRYSRIVRIQRLIIELMEAGNRADAELLLHDHLTAVMLDKFMDETRKSWLPGAHEGSQEIAGNEYLLLNDAILTIINNEKEDWEEEDDE